MSHVLEVKWTIVPKEPPQPLLRCSRCSGTRRFRTSEKFRINANGKQVDAWLIYKCTSCDHTWNRPILERRQAGSVDPLLLEALRANEPELAHRTAFDVEELRRRVERLHESDEVVVLKQVAGEGATPIQRLEIRCAVPYPVAVRLDRLLGAELRLARSRVRTIAKNGGIMIAPHGPQALGRPVRDGMRVVIDVPENDAERIEDAARGGVLVCDGSALSDGAAT
jgi:hypothetical protein